MASEDDWSEDEIRVCVEQYVEILRRGGANRSISKDVFLARAEKQLPNRNAGAVSRRMCNISHVVEMAGGAPVIGWRPLTNVGPTNTARITKMLAEAGVI